MKLALILTPVVAFAGSYFAFRTLRPPAAMPSTSATQAAAPTATVGPENQAAKPRAAFKRPTLEEVKTCPPEDRLRLIVIWLAEATAEEIPVLAAFLWPQWPEDSPGSVEWEVVAARWVEVEPLAALAYAHPFSEKQCNEWEKLSFGQDSHYLVPASEVYRHFLSNALEPALSALSGESGELLRQMLMQMKWLVTPARRNTWALANAAKPEAALWLEKEAPLRESAAPSQQSQMASQFAEALRAKDLGKCRSLLDSMPMAYRRMRLEMDYVAALAEQKSPAEAEQWAKANLKGIAKVQAITAAASVLAKTDPKAALAMLKANGVKNLRSAQLGYILVSAEGSSTHHYGFDKNRTLDEVLKTVAKTLPQEALAYLAAAGEVRPRDMSQRYVDADDTKNNGSLARLLFKDWARTDAAAAAKWLASLPPGKGASELAPLLAGPLMAADPEAGKQLALSLPPGEMRSLLIAHAAAALSTTDAAAGLQWAADHGGAEGLTAAFRQLVEDKPSIAAANFSVLPEAEQAKLLRTVTAAVVKDNPAALPGFFASLSPELQSGMDLRDSVKAFAGLNLEKASSWVNDLPPSEAKDSGISSLVDYLIKNPKPDPAAAAHWAMASAETDDQDRRLRRVAEAWQKQDKENTAQAIRASDLPAATQTKLLSYLK